MWDPCYEIDVQGRNKWFEQSKVDVSISNVSWSWNWLCCNSRIFSSIATTHNVCLNSHTDDDAFYGVVTNLDSDPTKIPSMDDDVSLFFTFPTLGLAIALRPGDILFFNPTIYHSVSSRCNPQQNIWCTSLYTKNAVVGGNDNLLLLENKQREVIKSCLV
jgi:hypothetical protein